MMTLIGILPDFLIPLEDNIPQPDHTIKTQDAIDYIRANNINIRDMSDNSIEFESEFIASSMEAMVKEAGDADVTMLDDFIKYIEDQVDQLFGDIPVELLMFFPSALNEIIIDCDQKNPTVETLKNHIRERHISIYVLRIDSTTVDSETLIQFIDRIIDHSRYLHVEVQDAKDLLEFAESLFEFYYDYDSDEPDVPYDVNNTKGDRLSYSVQSAINAFMKQHPNQDKSEILIKDLLEFIQKENFEAYPFQAINGDTSIKHTSQELIDSIKGDVIFAKKQTFRVPMKTIYDLEYITSQYH